MKFYEYVNQEFFELLNVDEPTLVIGQNVAAGSHLGGLTRELSSLESVSLVNSTNAENALSAFALGAAFGGLNTVFWLKQQDFLYLGLDALVNGISLLRSRPNRNIASCTFAMTVMDKGWEGPQATGNFSNVLSELTNCQVFLASGLLEGRLAIKKSRSTDFSLLVFSQKLLPQEIDSLAKSGLAHEDRGFVAYPSPTPTAKTLVVTANFALQDTLAAGPGVFSALGGIHTFVNIFDPTQFLNSRQTFDADLIIYLTDSLVLESNLVLHIKACNPDAEVRHFKLNRALEDRRPQDLSIVHHLEKLAQGNFENRIE